MSWAALLTLAAGSYGLKAMGLVMLRHSSLQPSLAGILDLLPIPLLAALVVVQTVDGGHRIVLDARLAALAVAAVLVWRRASFLVVVLAAAATAALLRLA